MITVRNDRRRDLARGASDKTIDQRIVALMRDGPDVGAQIVAAEELQLTDPDASFGDSLIRANEGLFADDIDALYNQNPFLATWPRERLQLALKIGQRVPLSQRAHQVATGAFDNVGLVDVSRDLLVLPPQGTLAWPTVSVHGRLQPVTSRGEALLLTRPQLVPVNSLTAPLAGLPPRIEDGFGAAQITPGTSVDSGRPHARTMSSLTGSSMDCGDDAK